MAQAVDSFLAQLEPGLRYKQEQYIVYTMHCLFVYEAKHEEMQCWKELLLNIQRRL